MRILVVDDHPEVLELVQRSLVRDAHEVHVASSVSSALAELAARTFDIVVLDLGLPDGSGEALCRQLSEKPSRPAILSLTAENRVASRVRCLDAGADDYLAKPFAVAELRARVRALSRRTKPAASTVLEKKGARIEFGARRAYFEGKEAPITSKEWAILELLAASSGQLVSTTEILERLWQRTGDAERASLEVLIGRIRRKLGADVVRTVRGEGYAIDRD